jgi:hypothetical protein
MNSSVCLSITLLVIAGCEVRRDRAAGEGYHGAGWANTQDGGKHALSLRQTGYPIEDCQVCHGRDGEESPVLSSCNKNGCHEQGVSFCGMCHGNANGPRPVDDAHDKHVSYCIECHAVPETIRDIGHLNGTVDIVFSGLAVKNQLSPTWDKPSNNCSNVYCHLEKTISWKPPTMSSTPCDTCHGNPPESHARFIAVVVPSSCTTCHPEAQQATHINGIVETNSMQCTTCHGQGSLGAPPAALDGSTEPTHRGVGAHRRHLDETLADRMGKTVACSACHVVPSSYDASGHIDTTTPADVSLVLGQYDAKTGQCSTSCHFDVSPGPTWTDTTGAARACDACHGFPPALTHKGTPHTPSSTCFSCHSFSPQTHVDGVVDVTP